VDRPVTFARKTVVVVLAVVAVLTLWPCGFQVLMAGKFLVFPNGFCSDDDARFLRALAREPIVTTAPAGFTEARTYSFQPCEGNGDSDYYGAVGTWWTNPATVAVDEVTRFYERLALDGGWSVERCTTYVAACARRSVDGTTVRFSLETRLDGTGTPRYVAEISYSELGT
jgi:hypothetical protein